MQQVKHWILLTTGLVASRCIDGHTTGQISGGTLIPDLADSTMSHLVDLIEIRTGITTDQQHTEQVVDVTDIIDIQRINDFHTIHNHIVSIEFRLQRLGGKTPDTLVILHKIHHTRHVVSITTKLHLLRWQEVASNLNLLCFRGNQVECHGVVGMHIR